MIFLDIKKIWREDKELLLSVFKHYGPWLRGFLPLLLLFALIAKLLDYYNLLEWTHGTNFENILLCLIGALVSIVVTTFSVLFVALQLASSQFSPRIIRSFFIKDEKVRDAFMTFVATITYCIALVIFKDTTLCLHTILAFILCFFCIGIQFPYLVFYIAENVNASSITRNIFTRTINEIHEVYGSEHWTKDIHPEVTHYQRPKKHLDKVTAPCSGYIEAIDFKALNSISHGITEVKVYVDKIVGNFVMQGADLMYILSKNENTRHLSNQDIQRFQACFKIGKFRSYERDVNYGVRQLVDMAIKAISPAVNDPTTAINCIDYLGAIVREAALSNATSNEVREEVNHSVIVNEFEFDRLVDLAFDQVYFWGKGDYVIIKHLLKVITDVIAQVQNPYALYILVKQVEDMQLDNLWQQGQPELAGVERFKDLCIYPEYHNSLLRVMKAYQRVTLRKMEECKSQEADAKAYLEKRKTKYEASLPVILSQLEKVDADS